MTTILSTKQPSEAYFVSFDFANALGSEAIVSASVAAIEQDTTTDVTDIITDVSKQTSTDTSVYVWVQAGDTDTKYLLTCQVVGSSGSQYELDALLPVEELQSDLAAYCSLFDLFQHISESDLIAITDDADTGSINQQVIDRAIHDADAEINAYVAGKYDVPLDPVPPIITKISVDLAIYRLSGRRGLPIPEDRKFRYQECIRMLRDIQKGSATLGGTTTNSQQSGSGPLSTSTSDNRIFTMTSMTNY